MKRYNEAEKLMPASQESEGNNYFQAQFIILKGIFQEKRYHNNKLAQQYYNTGLRDISYLVSMGMNIAAYAYFGLSRISEDDGEKHTRKILPERSSETG